MLVKNKSIKAAILAMTIIMLIITTTTSAFAQDDRMPQIEENTKSLKIEFYIEKSGIKTPIQGAEISIYRVSNVEVQGGSAEYTLLDKYSQLRKLEDGREITFNTTEVSQSQELAQQLAQIVGDPEFTATTNIQGECEFSDLEQGMYLVKEENAKMDAEKYEKFVPYLISVPLAEKADDGNFWIYSVTSVPKTTVKELPTEQPTYTQLPTAQKLIADSTKTNDQTKVIAQNVKTGRVLMITLPLLAVLILAFVVLKLSKKKVQDDDKI